MFIATFNSLNTNSKVGGLKYLVKNDLNQLPLVGNLLNLCFYHTVFFAVTSWQKFVRTSKNSLVIAVFMSKM